MLRIAKLPILLALSASISIVGGAEKSSDTGDTGGSSTGSQNQATVPSGPPDEEIPF